ncbi:MAG TPA: hypothetical protein VJP86_01880 [Vicinamibacterales bacterium]|jgi:hypothetical protein|nr:hypothetical protein [Vicinamibacterales bacterium]
MINYTERLTILMRDLVERIPELSFIDVDNLLVFARHGRTNAQGAFATCHCLTLPPSEPGYYFWRERGSGRITRRSEWFVTKSPTLTIDDRDVKYLISFVLPRFCDQTFNRSRKERYYPGMDDPSIAKLDTVVHELYHIDPQYCGIRRLDRGDGTYSTHCHSPQFFEDVARMVREYVSRHPDPSVFDFLRHDLRSLQVNYGGVTATTFRSFPSYPQRFIERLAVQPLSSGELASIEVEPLPPTRQRTVYTEDDLDVREFSKKTSRRLLKPARFKAA